MEFLDEQLKNVTKVSNYLNIIPYVIFAFIIWLIFLTIIICLLYFNIIDIKSIVEGMKQCVVSLYLL